MKYATTPEPCKAPHPLHLHEDIDKLMIVKEGQPAITIKGESKILGPDCVAFAMTGDQHGIENTGNTAAIYHVFIYESKFAMNKERAKQNRVSFIINWNDVAAEKRKKGDFPINQPLN